jgi:hypothetical protein
MWGLQLESLTFEQLDEFLSTRQPEGHRLDYKAEVPNDLAKIIAAFANTLGGLIVLGVDENPKTTEPIWPPASGRGMPSTRGLREKITQIARDAIYHPVSVRISPVIENKHLPGHSLLVVRVDQSLEMPHAVDGRRKIYVYERDGSTSQPYSLAEVDRIAAMLDRRRAIEAVRDRMLNDEIERGKRFLLATPLPIRWAAVVPVYPWKDVVAPSVCFKLHQMLLDRPCDGRVVRQQMPEGSYARGFLESPIAGGQYAFCTRLHSKGLVFSMEVIREVNGGWWNIDSLSGLLKQVVNAAAKVYTHREADPPGHVLVSLGMLKAGGRLYSSILSGWRSNNEFIDNEYRTERYSDLQSILDGGASVAAQLLDEVAYAFDMPATAGFFENNWTRF